MLCSGRALLCQADFEATCRNTMLTIRKEQLEVFDKAAIGQFEAETIQHLMEFSPKHSAALGDPGIRQVVRFGLKEAKKYGFTDRGPVRLYLECMYFFGSYFDQDLQLPWATDILIDCQYSGQLARANGLSDKTADYLRKVFGPEREYYLGAVSRMTQVSAEGSAAVNPEPLPIEKLKQLFPQKCQYIGESTLLKLTQWGIQSARLLALSTNEGVAHLTVLGFVLGHGFMADPQFPWISAILKDSAAGAPDARVGQVYKQTQDYLQQTLQ
jgi:hypothetical protein